MINLQHRFFSVKQFGTFQLIIYCFDPLTAISKEHDLSSTKWKILQLKSWAGEDQNRDNR